MGCPFPLPSAGQQRGSEAGPEVGQSPDPGWARRVLAASVGDSPVATISPSSPFLPPSEAQHCLTTPFLHGEAHPHLPHLWYLENLLTALLWDSKQDCEAGMVGIKMAI